MRIYVMEKYKQKYQGSLQKEKQLSPLKACKQNEGTCWDSECKKPVSVVSAKSMQPISCQNTSQQFTTVVPTNHEFDSTQ